MAGIERHVFDDRETLAASLADGVAEALARAIDERGRAILAVSGGGTPRLFFEELSTRGLAWDKVMVTLVDERFVPETHERSNQRLLATHLLRNDAARARVVPLYNNAPTASQAADRAAAVIGTLPRPFDAVILGMGTDGHTASFFPGGDRLAEALSPDIRDAVVAMTAPGADEPRLTLTWPLIAEARLLVLHIEGAAKKATLERAEAEGAEEDMPVRAVLRRAPAPVRIYWAP